MGTYVEINLIVAVFKANLHLDVEMSICVCVV